MQVSATMLPPGRGDSAAARPKTAADAPTQARALVAIAAAHPTADPALRSWGRPNSPFLAQLIATKQGAEQTRLRRRAAANEVSARYRERMPAARPAVAQVDVVQ